MNELMVNGVVLATLLPHEAEGLAELALRSSLNGTDGPLEIQLHKPERFEEPWGKRMTELTQVDHCTVTIKLHFQHSNPPRFVRR